MAGYYDDKLSAEKLRRCYELAPPRVRRYLEAEVDHVLSVIRPGAVVLELGCGYGRVVMRLADVARRVVGVDTSAASLCMAREYLRSRAGCRLLRADAGVLPFRDGAFDAVVCVQNGVSAFHMDRAQLVSEAARVAARGGLALFSSYSHKFWEHRLEWFELQASEGLVGRIDRERTRDGTIVCEDGFTATTISREEFRNLTAGMDADVRVEEVDESSVFCEIKPR